MKRREADLEIRRCVKKLVRDLKLAEWKLDWNVGRCESDEACAQVVVQWDYRRADMVFDEKKHDGASSLRDSVRHEMLHILLGPLEGVWEAIETALDDDKALLRTLKQVYTSGIEQVVMLIERTGLGRDSEEE